MNTTRIRDLWRGLDTRGQLTIVGSVLAVVVTAFFLFQYAGKPSSTVIGSGLSPTDTGQMVQALEAAGIPSTVQNGGTQISVQNGMESKARIALAAKNLPSGGQVGFEIFDKQKLGATDFQQKVDYQRALEGEIARTIEGIAGVHSADVQLVLPTDTLFTDQGSKASAAVLLNDGGTLDASAVASIAHLVGSSVKGLDPQDITITDDTGQLVWPSADAAGGVSAASKLRAEQVYSSQLAAQINAMLISTLGPGKAQARVHADLNVDQTQVEKVTYAKKGTPLSTDTSKETLDAKNAASTPGAGTAANVPTYSVPSGQAGNSNYLHQTAQTQFGVDKTVQQTTIAPGSVNKLAVALLVDKSVPPKQVAGLKASVASLAGIDRKRGDTISVSSFAFAKPPAAAPKPSPIAGIMANPMGVLKTVLIVFAALVFLFSVRRGLKRREGEGVGPEPTWLREIQGAMPLAALEAGGDPEALSAAERRKALRAEAAEIARQSPDSLAAQVGSWVKE